jgi:hypothetical protein
MMVLCTLSKFRKIFTTPENITFQKKVYLKHFKTVFMLGVWQHDSSELKSEKVFEISSFDVA